MPESSVRGISPLLAIPLGLLVGLALSSLLLRNWLTEFFGRRRRDSTAATEGTLPQLDTPSSYVDTVRLGEPPAAYESTPTDTTSFDEASMADVASPIPIGELEIAASDGLSAAGIEPTAANQQSPDDAPADFPTPFAPDPSGMTDPDPTGTMSNLFGLEVEDPAADATPESPSEVDLTHELTAKGLALPDATPESPTDMDLTQELTAKGLELPESTSETTNDMDLTHELTAKGLALPDSTPEKTSDMDVTSKHTVQELSELVDPEEDDLLSATLSEALGLLEQDYEDEFEASQIIDKPTLDPSFLDEDAPTIEELTEEKEDS